MSHVVARDVTVCFDGAPVVSGVSLEAAPGAWVGVIGPNGAGKSTLLRAVAGLVPFTGTIEIDGVDVRRATRRELARLVALVPQAPTIPEAMPVMDYVLLGRTPYISYWGVETAHDVEVAAGLVEGLDLGELAHRPMGTLSGGERQRAVLARALAQEPRVLLLDEPTAALDLGHQQQVMDLVDRLRRERRIAVVTALHDLTLAAQYTDHLLLMHGGVVVSEGEPEKVLTAANLTEFYGANVAVLRTEAGDLIVAPRRS